MLDILLVASGFVSGHASKACRRSYVMKAPSGAEVGDLEFPPPVVDKYGFAAGPECALP